MGGNGEDENTPTVVSTAIKTEDNRELAAVVADLVLEAKQHHVGLYALYNEICEAERVVPKMWGWKLVEAYERHVAKETQQILSLKAVIA